MYGCIHFGSMWCCLFCFADWRRPIASLTSYSENDGCGLHVLFPTNLFSRLSYKLSSFMLFKSKLQYSTFGSGLHKSYEACLTCSPIQVFFPQTVQEISIGMLSQDGCLDPHFTSLYLTYPSKNRIHEQMKIEGMIQS